MLYKIMEKGAWLMAKQTYRKVQTHFREPGKQNSVRNRRGIELGFVLIMRYHPAVDARQINGHHKRRRGIVIGAGRGAGHRVQNA